MPHPRSSEREQLDLFRALPGDLAPRDHQDLMAYPFFSLAKSPRIRPIDFRMGKIAIRVEAVPEHGMATIWDADVLIWAASQIVEARDRGCKPSRLMAATPYEILTFVGRGTSSRDYDRLKAALDRLQSTTVATSIRQAIRAADAPLLVDQRMEGARRRARTSAGARADPARLVLCRRAGRCARPHHRHRLLRPHGRRRALALPARAQARRSPSGRLEFRLPPPPRQVGQPLAVHQLRLATCATSSGCSRFRATGSVSSGLSAASNAWSSCPFPEDPLDRAARLCGITLPGDKL